MRVISGDGISYDEAVHHLEFTIEPFVEGQPGPHVTAAISAAEDLGATIDFGPFATICTVPTTLVADLVAAVTRAALEHGATHISLHISEASGS